MTEREKPKPCYRDNGVRFIKSQHRVDCDDPECRGCTPCPEAHHCTGRRNCGWHLAEGQLTCGRCISGVRSDLGWIVSLSALLLTQAIADGLDSQATNLAGPAVDPEAWSWRKAAARAHQETGRAWHVSLIEEDDEHHPMRVLGTWERMLREDYDQPADDGAAISGAAAYLNRNLYRVANDEHQDFALLRAELKKCRQHLESVLHNDEQRDQGAPCPDCVKAGDGAPRLVRKYALAQPHERFDVWQCPRNPDHAWAHHAYTAYVEDRRKGRARA